MVTHNIEEAVFMADRIVIMGKDPGHIVTEISVTLHQPRQRKDTAFQSLVDKVYAAVVGQSKPKEETLEAKVDQILKKLDQMENKSIEQLQNEVKQLRKELDELRSK
jgi:ABC-type proline/glycine betaine transport system ATPase subunit